jgi:hypothetical protein
MAGSVGRVAISAVLFNFKKCKQPLYALNSKTGLRFESVYKAAVLQELKKPLVVDDQKRKKLHKDEVSTLGIISEHTNGSTYFVPVMCPIVLFFSGLYKEKYFIRIQLRHLLQVRIKVKCCSVNTSDIMICHGLYETAPKLPFIPGFEVSGEILELGSKAAEGGLKVGDKIVGLNKDHFSGFAEECVLPSLVCIVVYFLQVA